MSALGSEGGGAIRSAAIRGSAKLESCTVHSPACNHNPETVIWAHSNQQIHGKGMGRKADDIFGCYACSACHDWLDGRAGTSSKEERERAFYAAMTSSMIILVRKGLLQVAA